LPATPAGLAMKGSVRKFDEFESKMDFDSPVGKCDSKTIEETLTPPMEAISLTNKPKRQRPNFFLGLRLTDPFFQQHVSNFQQNILLKSPNLKKSMVSVKKLHLTCFVFHLSSQDEIQAARECFVNCQPHISEMISSFAQTLIETSPPHPPESTLALTFDSMNQFGSSVLFFSPQNNLVLQLIRQINSYLSDQFQLSGLFTDPQEIQRVHNWQPHLTILKTSRQSTKSKIKKEDYENCTDLFHSGSVIRVEMNQIDLLAMSEQSDVDGYYKSYGTIVL
jgi:hypothetical protein